MGVGTCVGSGPADFALLLVRVYAHGVGCNPPRAARRASLACLPVPVAVCERLCLHLVRHVQECHPDLISLASSIYFTFVIEPSSAPKGSAKVRVYFLGVELRARTVDMTALVVVNGSGSFFFISTIFCRLHVFERLQSKEVHMMPRQVLTGVKGVTAKLLAKMEQRLMAGAGKKRKDIFREFLQDVIRKANPAGDPQQPKKAMIKELPEKVIIRKNMQNRSMRAGDDEILPVDLDEL